MAHRSPSRSISFRTGFHLSHTISPRLLSWLLLLLGLPFHAHAAALKTSAHFPPARWQAQQQEPFVLDPSSLLERELKGGESHRYQARLLAGHFFYVIVEQRGIDVALQLIQPDGKKRGEVNASQGLNGPEPLLLVIETSGTYQLEVRAARREAAAGRYQLKVQALREVTENDRKTISDMAELEESRRNSAQAAMLHGAGRYAEAIALTEGVLAVRQRILGAEHVHTIAAASNLAEMYRVGGAFDKAEPLFARVISFREKMLGPEHPDLARVLNNYAALLRDKADYERAAVLFERALRIRERALGPAHAETAASINNLAVLYTVKGDYTRAEPLYQRALELREKLFGQEHADVAQTLQNFATMYRATGDFQRAEPLFLRALSIYEKLGGGEHPETAKLINNLATLYFEKGDYTRAEPFYQRALAIFEKAHGTEHPLVAASLNDMATLHYERGDYERAEAMHLRAVAIREKALGAEHPDLAQSLINLANIYQEMNDDGRAEQHYRRALSILEKTLGTDHPETAKILNNLASLYHARGDYERARPLLERSLAIREKAFGTEHPEVAQALGNLAQVCQGKGDFACAEAGWRRAKTILEQSLGPEHPETAHLLNSFAGLYVAKGDARRAIELQTRANEVREKNLALILMAGSERQKFLYLAKVAGETDGTISLHAQTAPRNPAAARLALTTLLRRKGRALDAMADSIAILRRRLAPEDRALLAELAAMRTRLAALVLKASAPDNVEGHQAEVARLTAEAARLEAEVSRRSAEFRVQAEPVTIEQIQTALPAGSALVEIAAYKPFNPHAKTKDSRYGEMRYIAYVLRRSGAPQWVELGPAATIDREVALLRDALRDARRTDVAQLARGLDERLMRPVRAHLGRARNVFLSPDGALNLVPFAALMDERGRHLVTRYNFMYLTSGRDLLRHGKPAGSGERPMVFADPAFEPAARSSTDSNTDAPVKGLETESRGALDLARASFRPLPGTAEEARAIGVILTESQLLTGAQATETALKQVRAPHILHVATHGFFLADRETKSRPAREKGVGTDVAQQNLRRLNPLLRSGLALAGANRRAGTEGEDGILTALEAAGLDLWGTRLVVLSACETGVGEVSNGEGVYGLRRALVLAGAETQVMSLWQVSDRATRDLMVAYYKRLRAGEGRMEALREVQLEMLGSRERSHPYFWAGFIPIGQWQSIK